MKKGFALGVGATLLVLLIGGYLLVISGYIPANADATPSKLEYWMAKTSLRATLKRESPKVPDPVPLTDSNLIAGIQLFQQNCAICHGTAQGNPAASNIARGLYQKPPQLASAGVEDDPPGVTFWKVYHGIRLTAMPSFRYTLTKQQIWTLALFLKNMDHLPPAPEKVWKRVTNHLSLPPAGNS
ncbi:MAG: c-type cytochrome [Proteobacteria bacterium]|nr:c-type cytochrome [Pseudomonadota bacterium]MDE3208785.1 c-type cytochrome [Pseudomonadota bacterium]